MTDSSEDGWPSYAYVPGQGPHPRRSPRGHSFGLPEPSAQASPDERFWRNAAYRRGVALYDRGFYWEAHEAWEALWHAYGRRGPVATLLQALIQLAAAQVKIRQAMPRGVASLSGRAIAALRDLERQASLPSGGPDPAAIARRHDRFFSAHLAGEGTEVPRLGLP